MPATNDLPNVRVVVRLPYPRPENAPEEPPTIEWTSQKADVLWKVVEKQLSKDGSTTDWTGLADRLDVPLPYLLYRAQASLQEGLRGISKIPGIVTPSISPNAGKGDEFPFAEPQTVAGRGTNRLSASLRFSGSAGRNSTPLGIRARLSSLGANSPRPKRASSSSTLTLQAPGPGLRPALPLRPPSPSSSEGNDSDDEEQERQEEAERHHEERAEWDKHLRDLQRRMTSDALGLVSNGIDRGRTNGVGAKVPGTYSHRSESQSLSSTASSRHESMGDIGDIPSPPSESQPQSPTRRHMSPTQSSVSPRSAASHSQRRYGHLVAKSASEHSSGQGSQASSFSDIGSDASLSASALESALMSNIRGTGSRFSAFARSRLHRGSGLPH